MEADIRAPVARSSASVPKRVLVVDDMPEICEFFAALLRRVKALRIDLVTEVNSAHALEILRESRFDLVISDFRMKHVDGVEVLSAARAANPRGHRVLMTGYNEIPASIERIRLAGVDAYIQKPLRSQDLLLLVLDFLNENAGAIESWRSNARELELVGLKEERGVAAGDSSS